MADIRVENTRNNLKTTMLELLKTTPIDKLTVSEICKQANINRVTFYSHYKDKYQLFIEAVNDIATKVVELTLKQVKISSKKEDILNFCLALFNNSLDIIYEARETVFAMGKKENSMLIFIIQTQIKNIIHNLLKVLTKNDTPRYPLDIIAAFIVGGFSQIFYQWVAVRKSFDIEELRKYGLVIIKDIFNTGLLIEKKPNH